MNFALNNDGYPYDYFMEKLYVTYTKKNNDTGEIYSGMASGEFTDSAEDADKVLY